MFPFPTFRPNVSYEDTLSWTLNVNSSDNSGYTNVQTIPASIITRNGSSVIVEFESGAGDMNVTGAYIGEQASSGDAYDFSTTPTQLLFSGLGSFTLGLGSVISSDKITFSIDETKTYLIAFQMAAGGYMKQTNDNSQNTNNYYKNALDAATVNKSGYTGPDADMYGIKSVTIYGP